MLIGSISKNGSDSKEDTMLIIEVLNQANLWVQVASAYPNDTRLSDRLAVALRNNPHAKRARAKGSTSGRIYDIT